MSVQALPRPGVYPEQMIMWPRTDAALTVGGAVIPGGSCPFSAGVTCWGVSAGTATQDMQDYRENLCMRLTSGAGTFSQRQTDGLAIYLPLTVQTLAERFRYQEWQRVFRVQHLMARNAAVNPGTGSGVAFVLYDGVAANYPTGAGNGAGFGIQGDGAGNWQYYSKPTVAGGFVDQTALAWPVAVTEWVLVDWEIFAATPSLAARVNLYLNGVPVIARNWGVGTQLPDYTAIANSNQWRYGANAGTNGMELFVGASVFMAGRWSVRDGEQLNPENGSL